MSASKPTARPIVLVRLVTGVLAALTVAAFPPDPGAVTRAWHDRTADVDRLVAPLAGALLWVLAAWVLLALGTGAAARLPGVAGALGRATVRVVVPRALRGVLVGSLASGLVLGPAVAAVALPAPVATSGAATPAAAPAWPAGGTAAANPPAPAPRWPGSPGTAAASTVPPTPSSTAAGPAGPTSPAPSATPAPSRNPTPAPTAPAPTVPQRPTAPAPTVPTAPPAQTPSSTGSTVTVAPGDSLWSIVADHLTATTGERVADVEVALAWPRWYAANRGVVGVDPGLLHPGTVLAAPAGAPEPGAPS